MKKKQQIYLGLLAAVVLTAFGCKKDFLNKPPVDSIVDANFYKNDNQVLASTALLYSQVWYEYNDRASFNIGDYRGGTLFSAYNDRANVEFNTTGITLENAAAWRSLFIVVGQSNLAIANIERYATDGVSPAVKRTAIAEARFMRALAYRYLVMNWGDVPIITNNLQHLTDPSVKRNTVKSVWKFITSEMRAVVDDLPETPIRTGRVTKWSAEGMLARFYLTRAGVEATGPTARNQTFLDSAKYYSDRVIRLSGNKLLPNYADLFKYPYDNNTESLFSLQWVYAAPPAYAVFNSWPAYLNGKADFANGDAWGQDKSATWWLLSKYEGLTETSSTTMQGRTSDQRLYATFMLPGAHYPELLKASGGYTYPFTDNSGGQDRNGFVYAMVKKYIVGKAEDVGGKAASSRYDNDTYMLRLAEMYLIYAEATLGNNTNTSDPLALQYFNAVHTRSGLAAFTGPLQFHHISNERFVEFALEGMAWYDLVSLHYYNPQQAYYILNAQDRGTFFIRPNQMPNPTSWTFTKTQHFTKRLIVANSGNFLLPIPTAELGQAPNLLEPAVDY